MKTVNFGEHLMIDGYFGEEKLLNSKILILRTLNKLPTLLRMKKLSKPVIYSAPDNGIKDPGGWSGFVIIAESHISIHTFPKRRFLSADIYTCKNGLSQKLILDYFSNKFKLKNIEKNFVKRGTRYPDQNFF